MSLQLCLETQGPSAELAVAIIQQSHFVPERLVRSVERAYLVDQDAVVVMEYLILLFTPISEGKE